MNNFFFSNMLCYYTLHNAKKIVDRVEIENHDCNNNLVNKGVTRRGTRILVNRKDLMKENRAGLWLNASLVIFVIFTLIISYQAVIGLIESFNTIL